MTPFERNTIGSWGEHGRQWLQDLPNLITRLAVQWHLTNLIPMENLTYNYVLTGLQDDQSIVLKIGLDLKGLYHEAAVLKHWQGHGAINVLDADESLGALLLQRADPGITLQDYMRTHGDDEQATLIAINLMAQIHRAPAMMLSRPLPHSSMWLKDLDHDHGTLQDYLPKARLWRDQLSAASTTTILLHGDFHHNNIIHHHDTWHVIDSKGIYGDPMFEVGSFMRNPKPEILQAPQALDKARRRLQLFADYFGWDQQRLYQWCFVKSVLSAVWLLEDGFDAPFELDHIRFMEKLVP